MKQKPQTIETICQELAKDLKAVATGRMKGIDQNKVRSQVASIMWSLDSKSDAYRRKTYDFLNIFLEKCLGIDPSLEQIDKGSMTEFRYLGKKETGFRYASFRPKLISSMINKKLIGAYLAERKDIPEELKAYPTGVKDGFSFRVTEDDPCTPDINFVGIYDNARSDEKYGIDSLLAVIGDNRTLLETEDFGLADWEKLSEKGFKTFFRDFCQFYQEMFEEINEAYLYQIAEIMGKVFPTEGFELVNVADLPVVYRGSNGKNIRATAASQDFIMPGDPAGERIISQDFIVFETNKEANTFCDDMKQSLKEKKSSSEGMSYRWIGETESRHIRRGALIKDPASNSQRIVCQLKNPERVFIGLRGNLNNEKFHDEIFGHKTRKERKTRKGILDLTVEGRNTSVERAFSLRHMVTEAPNPYNLDHYTDGKVVSAVYSLERDRSRKVLHCKDYISHPRIVRKPDGSTAEYKALNMVAKINDPAFPDKLEFQIRTSWQNFQAERGPVSSANYEREKINRSDPRISKGALPETKKAERRKVCAHIDSLEYALIQEYKGRIRNRIGQIRSLFLDEKSYKNNEGRLNHLIGRLMSRYKRMMDESIVYKEARSIKGKLMGEIEQLPYILIGLVSSIEKEERLFLEKLNEELEKEGFSVPKDIAYHSNYKRMRPLIDAFVRYAEQPKQSKSDFIVFQTMAMVLDDFSKSIPSSHKEAQQNISRFKEILKNEKYFAESSLKFKSKIEEYKPKNVLGFVPTNFGGLPKGRQKQIKELAENTLKHYGVSEDVIGEVIRKIDRFYKEVRGSKKRNYRYVFFQ